jgi:ATP-binding cassette subfamily B protein
LKPIQLVFSYARRYRLVLIITIISMFLLVGVQLLVPWIIRTLINNVTSNTITPPSFTLVDVLALLVLGIYIVRAGMQFLRSYMAHLAGWGVVADVRKHIYEHLQALSLRYYEDKQTGQLMSRVINDTELFEQLISHAIPDVVVNLITLFGVSAVLLSLNWRLTLLSMIPIPWWLSHSRCMPAMYARHSVNAKRSWGI